VTIPGPPADLPPPGPTDPAGPDRALLATPTRQSPIAVVFIAARFLRNLGVVNLAVVAVVVVSGRIPTGLFGLGLVACVVGLVFMVAAWWRFVFTVDGGELLVARGVLAQERLTIPLDRIQSISIDQRFLHRLVGLVSVSVDTAGSADAELEIDAVDRRRAEALQRLAAGQARLSGPPPPGTEGDAMGEDRAGPIELETMAARSPGQLVRVGLARWPWAGLAALVPVLAFADDLSDLLSLPIDEERLLGENLPEDLGGRLATTVVVLVLAAVVVGTLLGLVLQVVRVLVTEWNLRLVRTSTGFRRTAGLLSTTSRASTRRRIQAVRTEETPMQRLLGIRQLTLPTIGSGDLVIPGATAAEQRRIRDEVFDAVPEPELDRRISPRWVFVTTRNRLLALAVAIATAVLLVGWWGLVLVVSAPPTWLATRRQWRLWWWGIAPDRIIESRELVDRRTLELELVKAQAVDVTRSFFERRRGLATVRIRLAEGDLSVPFLPEAEAAAVRDLVLHRVESDHRAWM
jgi:putative membrane protein